MNGCRVYRRRRGVTYVEVLVASLILTVCVAGIVHMWYMAFNLSVQTDQQGIGYAVGRRGIEKVKQTGFYNTPLSPATTTYYYDATGANESTTSSSSTVFKMTIAVSCDQTTTDSNGNTIVADTGVLTATVTVSLNATGKTLYSSSTALARAGI